MDESAPASHPAIERSMELKAQSSQPVANSAETRPAMTLEETRLLLLDRAGKRFGKVPAALLVEHLLQFTANADFPVRQAALDALLRRHNFGTAEGLAVATRPSGSEPFGVYMTCRGVFKDGRGHGPKASRPKGSKGRPRNARDIRPYATELESLHPLRGSCDCPDFLRSSLGVCKHLLVVLADLYANPKRLAKTARTPAGSARLAWDCALPLNGDLDRVTGLHWALPAGAGNKPVNGSVPRALRAHFKGQTVDPRAVATPARRSELLKQLESTLDACRATPAACAIVREERERAERLAESMASSKRLLTKLRSLKRTLYPYQRDGVQRFLSRGRLLLADDMGLGKTTQAIAACHALFHGGRVARGIIITPASLKAQWLREWRSTTDVPAAIVEGNANERQAQYSARAPGFLILNYEQLLRDFEHVQSFAADVIVLDEAQRIKNYATKTAVFVKALQPHYRLVLTGTPFENRLEELASVMDWVDDVALAPKWRLAPWHTRWEGNAAEGVVGARNLDTLRARLSPVLVRRIRTEVLRQLPARTDTRVPVEMTPQQADEHSALDRPILTLMQTGKRRPLLQSEFLRLMSLLARQRMISNGLGQIRFDELWPTYRNAQPDSALLEGLFAPKLFELRRLISDLVVNQRRKVVVFSQWRNMLRLAEWSVRDLLANVGARAVFFTGAESQALRTRAVVDFHDEPSVPLMFLSDAGGVGLNLQRAATACINLELPWNPAVLEQRVGRIYRLGQEHPIDVYNLVCETGIESRIANLVGSKQALFKGLFDAGSDEVRFDAASSFLSRLERLVEPPASPPIATSVETTPKLDVEEDADVAAFEEAENLPEAVRVADASVAPESAPAAGAKGPGASSLTFPMPELFAALRVERMADGGMRIEAPPEAAASLGALFEGMAKLMGQLARPG